MNRFRSLFLVLTLVFAMSATRCAPIHHSNTTLVKVKPGSAPAQVTAAFNRDHPNTMIQKVVKETYSDGTVHYQYTFTDVNGTQQTVEYNAAGEAVQ